MEKKRENEAEQKLQDRYGQEMDINKKLIINMRDLNHIMRSLYEGKASQQRILIILNEAGSITQRDLTMRLGIQPGSASEILAKLENAGFILRTISETDRRTANISLTELGKQMAASAAEQRSRRHVEMFACLSESEKTNLLALLEKVNGDWTRRYGTAAEDGRGKHHGRGHGCEGRYGGGHRHGHEEAEGYGHRHGHEGGHEEAEGHGRRHGHEGGHEEAEDHGRRHGHEGGHEEAEGHGHRHGHEGGHEEAEDHGRRHGHEDRDDYMNSHDDASASGQGKQFTETEEPNHVEVH